MLHNQWQRQLEKQAVEPSIDAFHGSRDPKSRFKVAANELYAVYSSMESGARPPATILTWVELFKHLVINCKLEQGVKRRMDCME